METKMIPVSHVEAMIQDLATQARIEEYDCACRLNRGDIEGAKLSAKRADIMRQAFFKVTERLLNETNCGEQGWRSRHGCVEQV